MANLGAKTFSDLLPRELVKITKLCCQHVSSEIAGMSYTLALTILLKLAGSLRYSMNSEGEAYYNLAAFLLRRCIEVGAVLISCCFGACQKFFVGWISRLVRSLQRSPSLVIFSQRTLKIAFS